MGRKLVKTNKRIGRDDRKFFKALNAVTKNVMDDTIKEMIKKEMPLMYDQFCDLVSMQWFLYIAADMLLGEEGNEELAKTMLGTKNPAAVKDFYMERCKWLMPEWDVLEKYFDSSEENFSIFFSTNRFDDNGHHSAFFILLMAEPNINITKQDKEVAKTMEEPEPYTFAKMLLLNSSVLKDVFEQYVQDGQFGGIKYHLAKPE